MDIAFDSHCSTEYGSTELYTPYGAEQWPGVQMDIVFDSHCSTEYGSTELYTPQGAEKV